MSLPEVATRARVAGSPQGAAGPREGVHPPEGRPQRGPPPPAHGGRREGLHLRGAGGHGDAGRPVRRAPSAGRLPLHVRSGSGTTAARACTAGCDELSAGLLEHLGARSTAYAVVARAPYEKIAAYKEKRGWTFPFFSVERQLTSTTTSTPPSTSRGRRWRSTTGPGPTWRRPRPASSTGSSSRSNRSRTPDSASSCATAMAIFHTNSTFARGTEECSDSYGILDHTALGRQEDWEEPKGRADIPTPPPRTSPRGTTTGARPAPGRPRFPLVCGA